MAINRNKFLEVFDETTGDRAQDQNLLETYKEDAINFLPKLQNNDFPLYGLIGEYGTGKSTFLNAVKYYDKLNTNTNNVRITFEARKYPNRKELWDAFIIEVLSKVITHVTQIENENVIFEIMDDIKKHMIGGEYNDEDKIQSKRNIIKERTSQILKDGGDVLTSTGGGQVEGSTSQVAVTIAGMFTKFLGTTIGSTISKSKQGVSRIFDYEYFFAEYWIKIVQQYYNDFNKVYIIIEDIDRCGEEGMVFIETLSYFMNNISRLEHNMNKITCLVSIGQGFLNNNRHLINKAITSYEIFEMKSDRISVYFESEFNDESIGLDINQKTCLNNFIGFYLDLHKAHTRTIREIKYLFKKIIPVLLEKYNYLIEAKKEIDENILLGMILYNFSCFIRSNKIKLEAGNFGNETFDSTKALYYCRIHKKESGDPYFYIPYLDIIHNSQLGIKHYVIFDKLFNFYGRTGEIYELKLVDSYDGLKVIFIGESKKLEISEYRLLNS